MAQQLKGTLTITRTDLIGVFKSEDGETTYTYAAKDFPHPPVVVDKIDAVLDVVEPDILRGLMPFHGHIGPAAIVINMDEQEIIFQAQLREPIIPPFGVAGVGIWSQSSS